MITRENLPAGFVPYETLVICNNTMLGGGHVLSVGDALPLVVGKGEKPQIWLQALQDQITNKFEPIIESSVSKHPSVEIIEKEGNIEVTIQKIRVLVVREEAPDKAVISLIDFKPIGLNLVGNTSNITVGGTTLSGNTMSGGGVLIGFGK